MIYEMSPKVRLLPIMALSVRYGKPPSELLAGKTCLTTNYKD